MSTKNITTAPSIKDATYQFFCNLISIKVFFSLLATVGLYMKLISSSEWTIIVGATLGLREWTKNKNGSTNDDDTVVGDNPPATGV
jgi:hypothetical protein